jgi:hypothetical protein
MIIKSPTKNENGIALILAVLILTNLLMITLVVNDVVMRIGKSSQSIGESEVAYLAAESGIEKAIYQIEKNHDASLLGTISAPSTGDLPSSDGHWILSVAPVYTLPITCVDANGVISYPSTVLSDQSCLSVTGPISKQNPLTITLQSGKSFELDLNLSVPSSLGFYPNHLDLDWPNNTAGQLIILGDDVQEDPVDTAVAHGYRVSIPNCRIRLINSNAVGAPPVAYTIKPHDASEPLSIGITITSKGYYKTDQEKERIIVVERRNWQIY